MKIEVTTPSKKAQPLSEVPAAIYVITQEDIRRSGATSIPELLRMVPGVQVAQIDANKWAISARGFNSRFSNKLLVLVDGRSVYTPLYSGVYWDAQDTLLEDIERIEVIRGPGGSLWGANAVNGIINIITKSAKDTTGNLLTAGTGNQEKGFGGLQHGGKIGQDAFYRVYGKYFMRAGIVDGSGAEAPDKWEVLRGGFRFDKGTTGTGTFMVQGDVYHSHLGQRSIVPTLTPPFSQTSDDEFPVSGWDVLTHWDRQGARGSRLSLQMYLDQTNRDLPEENEARSTFDFDSQYQAAPLGRHSLIYGLGYRRSSDHIRGSFAVSANPASRTDDLYSTFVHDEVTLNPKLRLTLGSKFEHNGYTGFEVQPNVRLAWTPDDRRTLWAAVSRAVRTPNRANQNVSAILAVVPGPGGIPTVLTAIGDERFRSENVLAYELGYRLQPTDRLLVDIATFYNVYQDLEVVEPGQPLPTANPPPPHVVVPLRFANHEHGNVYGLEVAGRWTITNRWKVSLGESMLQPHLRLNATSQSPFMTLFQSPRQQFNVSSYLNMPGHLEFDTSFYFVSRLVGINIPSYTRFDARLGWRPKENFEVSLAVQNLFMSRHHEFGSEFFVADGQVPRSIYGKVTRRF